MSAGGIASWVSSAVYLGALRTTYLGMKSSNAHMPFFKTSIIQVPRILLDARHHRQY